MYSTGADLTGGTFHPFHHVAVTADGTNITFYADGIQVGQAAQSEPLVPNTGFLQIGNDEPILPNAFDGLIDEVSIYNRALSAAKIQAIYKRGPRGQMQGLDLFPPAGNRDQGRDQCRICPDQCVFDAGARGDMPDQLDFHAHSAGHAEEQADDCR